MSDPLANGTSSDSIDQSPKDAVEEYIVAQQGQRQTATLKMHKGHLSTFVNWCEDHEIDSLTDLQPDQLTTYCVYRRDHHNLSRATLKHNRKSLRGFLRWAVTQRYCHRSLLEHIRDFELEGSPNSHDHYLPPKYGNQIVAYHRKNHRGSEKHALIELGWSTGLRPSAIRSLDVDDINYDKGQIELTHRPRTGTPLKNGKRAERTIPLPEQTVSAILNWLTNPNYPPPTDGSGRHPLFPSLHGRRQQRSICKILRIWPYQYLDVTPAHLKSKGPFDKESHYAVARDCPASVSPQALRKSVAVRQLRNGMAIQKIASQMDCSEVVIRRWDEQRNKMAETE